MTRALFSALFFLCLATTATAYDGLIAPADDTPAAGNSSGYGGLIAPDVTAPDAAAPPAPAAPPAAAVKSPPAPAVKQTAIPGRPAPAPAKGSVDLLGRAADERRAGRSLRAQKGDDLFKVAMPKAPVNWQKAQPAAIDGMLPAEYDAKTSIDSILTLTANDRLPAAMRKHNARAAYGQLKTLAESLRLQRQVPDSYFKSMGMPDDLIAQTRGDSDRALSRVEEALRMVEPLQR